MGLRKIIRMFDTGNVCVTGLRGKGKDLLMANVVIRRGLPYVSNVDYGGKMIPLKPVLLDCGGNTYHEFINSQLRYYKYPYEDGVDVYISDAGVYFPAQYCNELNRQYGYMATFMALSRHLGECNVHVNAQNLNRVWDKIREQSDLYITCKWVWKWLLKHTGIVVQRVMLYELYDSAVKRVPLFCLKKPWFNPNRKQQYDIQRQQYQISYGNIRSMLLIYRNKSSYDTRIFKEALLCGKKSS